MTLSSSQMKEIAKAIVAKIVADVLFEHEPVRKGVDRVKKSEWTDSLDACEDDVFEILIRNFGVSDL